MITDEQKEAVEAVEKINDEIIEALNNDSIVPNTLNITLSGCDFHIDFIVYTNQSYVKLHIYNSANDDRILDEHTGEYESFYNYIKRKFNEIKTVINNINL